MEKEVQEDFLCKVAKDCVYGVPMGSAYFYGCDYIGKTGKSRVAHDPDGEIVNGRCKRFKDKKDAGAEFRKENNFFDPKQWWPQS